MKHFLWASRTAVLIGSLSLLATACNEPQDGGNAGKNDSAARRADTTVMASAQTAAQPFTLPVLDALFYEEGFEDLLRSQLSLTDEQITKLKTAAQEATADLSEEGVGDYTGSAREATQRSDARIREILGDDKAQQLYGMVAQRFHSGEVEGMLSTQPNAVPTDTRIVVNAPAYRMDIFENGQLTKTYKVGIGYPEFPLPTGMRRAETIIFNPTWTPPDEPWVKGKFKPGRKVEAGSKDNPLGPIKIPIGLPSLIHGGKQVAKLGTFASHGCVGLTNAQVQEFASLLATLGGSPLSADSVKMMNKQKAETKNYKLAAPVPVELRYETIVAEASGLRIYRDVYERGTNTLQNARRVLEAVGVSYDKLTPQEQQALTAALEEMNRDARGNPIAESVGGADSTAVASADSGKKSGISSTERRAKQGKETRTIVGRKEVAVPIAALSGKGYPAPVALNAGNAQTTAAPKR